MAKRPTSPDSELSNGSAVVGARPGTSSPAVPNADERVDVKPSFHEVQLAAYLRWLREGGDEATNWAAAEAELTAKLRQQRGL